MKLLSLLLLATVLLIGYAPRPVEAGVNGGNACAVCTLVLGLMEQSSQIHNRTLTQEAEWMCQWLPGVVGSICKDIMEIVGPIVFPIINDTGSADVACNFITLCKNESGQFCRLFPEPPAERSLKHTPEPLKLEAAHVAIRKAVDVVCEKHPLFCGNFQALLGIPPTHRLRNLKVSPPPGPTYDTDKDTFSDYAELRGYFWKGKDCDDLDGTVFPGRDTTDMLMDQNCNGISGVDSATGQTYEEQWCANTGAMGIALLGDSATAHFRIPAEYVTAADWNSSTWNYLFPLLENDADWPMLSWGTGFMNTSSIPVGNIRGPMNSLYEYMRQHNLCNNNDYQNIGVNGAEVSNLVDWAKMLNRNGTQTPTTSTKPLLLFFSMIGNDVCGAEQNFVHMTTPEEYYTSVYNAVVEADSFLPAGSMIVLVPLVDGRILYDTMHARIHPVGKTNNDVTYADLYNYLNCLEISPCWGWMNSNETVRNTTWAIADSLNAQLPKIVNDTASITRNVKVIYPGEVMNEALKMATVPHWELIEPVDGFHPSQTGNALIAEAYWTRLVEMNVLPPANPNNAAIAAKFNL
jgi:acyloxyacyl hydrolase